VYFQFLGSKEPKEKRKQEVEEVKGDENQDKNMIKWFGKLFLKQSKKERKLMARLTTNFSH